MPSIHQAGRETEHPVLPDDAKFVTVDEAHEHGYHGISPDTTPRSEYTFAAQAAKLTASTAAGKSAPAATGKAGGSHRGTDK